MTTWKGRRIEDVLAWFTSRPQDDLDGVAMVGLDMSKSFYSSLREVCGDHVQVIERFHVVPQAVDGLDRVLHSVQKQLDSDEAKDLKNLRKRWLQSPHQLDADELIARADWRRRFPELRAVIDGGQDLQMWCERKYAKPAREALLQLIARA